MIIYGDLEESNTLKILMDSLILMTFYNHLLPTLNFEFGTRK